MALNDRMPLGRVVKINGDGTVSNADDIDPPTVLDEKWDDEKWQPLRGYTGQYGVTLKNFVMHNAEFIGGGMERDMFANPGLYVAVEAGWSCTEDCEPDCEGDHPEGWVVFTIPSQFVATVNVPGYLPMDDDPPVFDSPREAWQYLVSEVDRQWDEYPEDENGASLTAHTQLHNINQDRVGAIHAPTPGYTGDHDLGLVYSVSEYQGE